MTLQEQDWTPLLYWYMQVFLGSLYIYKLGSRSYDVRYVQVTLIGASDVPFLQKNLAVVFLLNVFS